MNWGSLTILFSALVLSLIVGPGCQHYDRGCPQDGGLRNGKLRTAISTRRNGYFPHVDHCSEIRPGALPAPPGYYMKAHRAAAASEADQDDFVIYTYEWVDESLDLGPFGQRHIAQIARAIKHGATWPVIVAPFQECPKLTEPRRAKVVQLLANMGIPDANTRVRVAYPLAEGLYGDEAEFTYPRMISPQNGFGNGLGGFGNGFGGFGGGLGGFGSGFGGFGGGLGGFGGGLGGFGGGFGGLFR
ncbi:MAG: hypothetical protein ACFCD0_24600 [Gemmataceae bacterium]